MNELTVKDEIKATTGKGIGSMLKLVLFIVLFLAAGLCLGGTSDSFRFLGLVLAIAGIYVAEEFHSTARRIQGKYHIALELRETFLDQKKVESVLAELAKGVRYTAKIQLHAQKAIAYASPDSEPKLRELELDATNQFNQASWRFYNTCRVASASGFDVLVTGEGRKYSYKLYAAPEPEAPQPVRSSLEPTDDDIPF